MKTYLKILSVLLITFAGSSVFAHPTGNMIVVGDHVLWSYVNPLDDPEHHACIMIWSEGTDPMPLITSKFAASDFMMYSQDEDIYIIERRYVQSSQKFEIRILKTKLGENPTQIWPWFEDKWRIGEGGFLMKSDEEIVFGSYPNVLKLKKGSEPTLQFDFKESISGIRPVSENKLLLKGEKKLLFSSKLIFDGSNPKPHLLLYTPDKDIVTIWSDSNEN